MKMVSLSHLVFLVIYTFASSPSSFAQTHSGLENDRAACIAQAVGPYGYRGDGVSNFCSLIQSHGQALCFAGAMDGNLFVEGVVSYCSFIASDAQGICMAGEARAHTVMDGARNECGVKENYPLMNVPVELAIPNQNAEWISDILGPRAYRLVLNGRTMGQLFYENVNVLHCALRNGAGHFHSVDYCDVIADHINLSVGKKILIQFDRNKHIFTVF